MDGLDLARGNERAVLAELASRSQAKMAAENFPVALRLVPRGPRSQLIQLYNFARFVDDVGDIAAGDRISLLDAVDADVRRLETGEPAIAPVRALRSMVDECAVPLAPFLDLVEANRIDQRVDRYAAFADLLDYCRLSAAPVGRVVLAIAGAATDENIADSDSVCAALQVLEHCQDVGEDAQMGRVYLPSGELHAAGIDHRALLATSTSGRLRSVISVQVERSLAMLVPGRALVRRLTGWPRIAVAGYVAGGLATAAALRQADYDVLSRPVVPAKLPTAGNALMLLMGRR